MVRGDLELAQRPLRAALCSLQLRASGVAELASFVELLGRQCGRKRVDPLRANRTRLAYDQPSAQLRVRVPTLGRLEDDLGVDGVGLGRQQRGFGTFGCGGSL